MTGAGLTRDGGTGVLGAMKRYVLTMLGIVSCAVTPACAAGDVDLLSFDPVPQKKISDAPPVEVTPPQVKPEPPKQEAPQSAAEKPAPVDKAPELKAEPARPQPPVEVVPPKIVKAPVAKQSAPQKPKPEIVKPVVPEKPAAAPVVKPPAPNVTKAVKPPPQAELHPEPHQVEAPQVPSQEAPHDPGVTPLAPEALHDDKPLARKVILRKAEKTEETPPAAPESFVKLKEPVIQAGDPLRIEVEGESDLSGWYKVMPDGAITLPMIGKIRAQGFTASKLAEILTATLKDGYLVNPRVTVTGKAAP